ncbi:metalloregulator ArsR/SmtB family transcription factor [Marinobacter sp.]|uniref:metalloregulator ArsR/SmtB family transcription factor n=1 Tax=Marinobacter sp. TaxID=50741 RepID=UPI00385024EE
MSSRRKVLFVCTANSARSLMAEALLRKMAGDQFEVASAGTHPEAPHPLAIQCIEEAGLDSRELHSKSMSSLADEQWDYVITLCDKAAFECLSLCDPAQRIAWDFPDPAIANRHSVFALVMKELKERISLFVMVHQKSSGRASHYPPASVFKALGDESRLGIMLMIQQEEELCVCELTRVLEASQPSISRQLSQLREQGLLADERRGQWVYYRLHPMLPGWIHSLLGETAKASARFLSPLMERLAAMPDRPKKADCA